MSKQWYLLSSKTHKDSIAEQHLSEQGYEVYRPLAQRSRKRNNKILKVTESLFPSYMFVSLDVSKDQWAPIRSTIGVNKIISFGQTPAVVPNEVIHSIKMSEERMGKKVIDLDRFKSGDHVSINSGAFKDINSIFLNYDGEQRAMILVGIMGTVAKVRVSSSELVALN